VIRREDISSTNTVASQDIAELRVAYGGRGTISDMQTPRYGSQLLDVILPF
jgi:flagellar L-ring protein precursor FlgH